MWELAGMAAQVLGSVVQGIAANQAKQAMKSAFNNEMKLQRGYRNEGFGVLQNHFPTLGVETAREQMETGQARREGLYDQVGQQTFSATQPSGFGQSSADKASLGMTGKAKAKLGSYSDWQLDQMISRIRAQDELNRISNFSGGDAQVFPYKMYDAEHSADELAMIGSVISSLGGMASGMGGLGGMGGGSGGGFGGGAGMALDAPSGFGQSFGNVV